MKIIKNSDIKFRINKKLVYLPNFTIRFYTINQKEYFLEKTQDDLVEYEREATVDDVDVILSGGTTVTEYYLPLNWNQLMFVGKGVLNYKLTNNIEDPEFPDYQYNKEEVVTTDFYIDSIEVDPEPEEGLIERIVLLEEHLAEEIVNREEADATITENLNAEEARAISAETALDEKIDAEETRASGEEQRIEGKLDQEIADRQTDVNTEEARAISAETALDAKIDAETNRATTAESALTDTINAEANRATAAEEALDTKANTISGNVITETTRATAKEDAISGKLDTYIASNDAALQSEVTRATTAEEALQTAINDEATARANADTALQTAITNEVSRAKEAESGITDSLNAEVTRATSAEAALDAKIDTVSGNVISETSRATTAEEALSGAVDTLINSKASQSDLDALNGVVTAHTADTTVHVTTSDKTKWNKVDDKLDVTDFNTYSGSVDTRLAEDEEVTSRALNALNEAVSGKVDTSAITTSISSGSTDAQVPSAKAVYDIVGNIETLLSQI